jgi:electron transfer flavoprotein alpha subunit
LFGTWKVREQPPIAHIAPAPRRSGPLEVWVVAEEVGGVIRPVVLELLGKAAQLARAFKGRVSAVLLGHRGERQAAQLTAHGADRVLLADHARLSPYQTDLHAAVLTAAIGAHTPGVILIPATAMGRDMAARVAARLGLGLTGDCVDIGIDEQGRLLQYKPAFGGSVVAPIVSRTVPEMATVRPGMLPLPAPDVSKAVVLERLEMDDTVHSRTRIVSRRVGAETAVELDSTEIAIGVGMGLGEKAHLAVVEPLARVLGAALCTTRDVTDAGWLPKQYQVGLTGRAIAPKLYIAVGIRGAFEHMVGVRNAGLIVAVNKNAKAPIFKSADYGIVADYAEFLPALCRHLSAAHP